MGYHTARGGFAMSTGHRNTFLAAGEFSQHLGTFFHFNATVQQVLKFGSILWHSRGVDSNVDIGRYFDGVVVVMYGNAFGGELLRERAFCAVVAIHSIAPLVEESCQGAHANASYA